MYNALVFIVVIRWAISIFAALGVLIDLPAKVSFDLHNEINPAFVVGKGVAILLLACGSIYQLIYDRAASSVMLDLMSNF